MPRNLHAKCGLSLTWFYHTLVFPHCCYSVSRRLMGVCSAWLMPGSDQSYLPDSPNSGPWQLCLEPHETQLPVSRWYTPPYKGAAAAAARPQGRVLQCGWQLKKQQRGGKETEWAIICCAKGQQGRCRRSTVNMWLVGMIFFLWGPKVLWRRGDVWSQFHLLRSRCERNHHLIYRVSSSSHNQRLPRPRESNAFRDERVEKVSMFRGKIQP